MAAITAAPALPVQHHIQNFSDAQTLQPHWGYADRALPCTNDAGSCAYLDVVYHSHDLGVVYCGIIWATIVGILLVWGMLRGLTRFAGASDRAHVAEFGEDALLLPAGIQRQEGTMENIKRRHLLRESGLGIFGRATRLQILILATLVGYLTLWSFVGIVYKTWITSVKKLPGVYNTRTSLGPWADRVGVLAFALTPLSVMLSSRESILSLITGVPYQNFNFLHRWLGYIIVLQSSLHTIGWCIIEDKLYQPQPTVGREWISQLYMIWGIVAMIFVAFLFVFSLPPVIKLTGYEFFRKSHYIVAMLYIGACWGHWAQLNCFMIASLVVWFLDRGVRLLRTALLHYSCIPKRTIGFRAASTNITYFPDAQNGDIIRLDFVHAQQPWKIGQHFYLCFPELSIWQSHPFTPASVPNSHADAQQHSYIIRAKSGATKKLAKLAHKKLESYTDATTSVILTGPYGEKTLAGLDPETNILCIAGGTGITYVLPILLQLTTQSSSPNRKIELVWAVRRKADVRWIEQEFETLQRASKHKAINLSIRIFVTRESIADLAAGRTVESPLLVAEQPESSASFLSAELGHATDAKPPEVSVEKTLSDAAVVAGTTPDSRKHPDLAALVKNFHEVTVRGCTTVYTCGPGGMIADLRATVADRNLAEVFEKGDERAVVRLVCDDRLEW